MALSQRKLERPYTYKDYLQWDIGERWEIIDGIAYMQAATSWEHQRISGGIYTQFYNYLADRHCQAYASPFDVRLPEGDKSDEDTETTVQPDTYSNEDKISVSIFPELEVDLKPVFDY